jgi:predicted dehydrogenase
VSDVIKVGVIGASAERGFARWVHLPALGASPHYRVAAVAASDPAKAAAAAALWGADSAYDDPLRLLEDPEVDLVTIAVPLTRRDGLVAAAIEAGKHVYCEWPLAYDGVQAAGFRDAADAAGVANVSGLQSRHHPVLRHLRDLVAGGWAGTPLTASLTWTMSTPPTWPARHRSLINTKAVSRLHVVGGHVLDIFRRVVGEFTELSATLATRLPEAVLLETGERLPIGTPDQISVTGTLQSGAVGTVQIVTGSPQGAGYRLEVHGTAGRLLLVSSDDSLIGPQFALSGSQGPTAEPRPIPLPDRYRQILPDVPVAVSNVHQVYSDLAESLRTGSPFAPSFEAGAEVHRIIDAIEASAATGIRQRLARVSGSAVHYRCGNLGPPR